MVDPHPGPRGLSARSPLDDLQFAEIPARSGGPGVVIRPLKDRSATLLAPRPAMASELGRRLVDALGISLPGQNGCARANAADVLWQGPARWLVLARVGMAIEGRLRNLAAADAAVVDQSGALVPLELEGDRVRAALAKMLPIDLHPRSFRVGEARSTIAGHIGVQIARPADSEAYLLLVPRSTALDFVRWLATSSAEFGVAME